MRAPLVVRRPITSTYGAALVVAPTEVAIFVQGSRVVGTVGPGTHLLDPRALPFLQVAQGMPGAEAFIVTLAVHGVRIRGSSGEVFDSGSGLGLSPRLFGEVGMRIVDAPRAALVAASAPSSDADATLRGHIQHAMMEGAKTAMLQAGQEGRLVRLLTDRAAQPELSEAIARTAAPRLAELGVEISAFGSVVVALSEEDMARVGALDAGAPMEPVYEMLWDCRFCGAKKLLGLTHRHCPNCGAPQNAAERYFPTDSDKTPAKSHEYYGADVHCTHCGVANSKNSKHCAGCGAPLEGAKEVARQEDHVKPAGVVAFMAESPAEPTPEPIAVPASPAPAAPRKRGGVATLLKTGCLAVVVLIAIFAALALWRKPGGIEVVGHSWKRVIAVERYGPVNDTAWCDQMPSNARGVTHRREVRSHERVRDGEDCQTRRIDRGNGTFAEKQECTPRYRDEPVYADRCSFTVERWSKQRSATAEGASVSDAPHWPDPSLARQGSCDGCEREGSRDETYTVVFRDQDAREHSCDFDQQRWTSFSDGSRWKGALGVVGGVLDCSSIATP
jgi:hypothetical protein